MKKILFVILLVCVLTFAFVACDEIDLPVNEHQHSFSDKWTYDENNHWHAATCEHSDEVDGKSAHDLHSAVGDKWRKECLTCGYSFTVQHEHTFAKEYSANEHGHWLETTCGCDYENFAPHGFVDGVCATCGWWSSASDVLLANLAKSDVFNYVVMLDDIRVNTVNYLSEGAQPSEITVSGELQLSLSADGLISGCGYLQAEDLVLKAVVSDNEVYAVGNGNYIRCALDELLKQNGIDVQTYLDELNANTQQIREYVVKLKQTVAALPVDGVITDELLSALIKIDESKSTDNLTVYVVDYDVLRTVNEALSTVTVEQYVNALLAQLDGTPLGALLGNSFEGLPNRVRTLLTQTVGKTITDLWKESFTLDDLLEQINQLIAKYYPDEKVNDLDELAAAMDVDLKGLTVKQTIVAASILSPETIWNNMQQEDDDKISAKEISEKLAEWRDEYGDKTVYQIIAIGSDDLSDEDVKLLVDEIANMLDESLRIEFYVDNDGILQQVTVSVDENAEQQLLKNFSGTITLKRDCELEQDYSQVIEQVNQYYSSLESSAD